MEKKFFTVAGTCYHMGTDFMEKGMKVILKKDKENEYDSEAIRVEMEGLGLIGFVANSVKTRKGETMSAGRLYDKIGDRAVGTVVFIFPDAAVCELEED